MHGLTGGKDGDNQARAVDASLAATLAGIRRWSEVRRQEDPDSKVVKGRVAEALAGFLGPEAAGRLVEPVTERSKLFPAVEPVLAIFLGCRAAARLVQHVVDRAIVRI